MDPAASFDAEVARLADAHNADVVFQLVDREGGPMDEKCWLHEADRPPGVAYRAIIEGESPDGQKISKEIGLCYKHGVALQMGNSEELAKDANEGKLTSLEALRKTPTITIEVKRPDRGRDPAHRDLPPPGYDAGR